MSWTMISELSRQEIRKAIIERKALAKANEKYNIKELKGAKHENNLHS